MAASSYYSVVQKAYIAYYGRPADTAGLTYWATRIDAAGGNISSIIQAFGNSAEATALYGNLSNGAAVNALYQQLFGRAPDITGYNFYVDRLTAGTYTLVDVAQRILDGASGNDATIIANKLTAAQSFTNAIDTVAEAVGYAGDAAAAAARTWLATVSTTSASLTAATTAIDGTLSNIADIGGSSTAAVNLTTSVETVTGTNGNDTFNANTIDGASTLNPGDIINGGNGTDTLNIVAYGSGATGVTLNSVEKVNIRLLSAQSFDTALWSGMTNLNITNESTAASATFTSLGLGTTVGVAGAAAQNVKVTYADLSGDANTGTLKLDSASATNVTYNAGLENLTVTNSGTSRLTVSGAAATTFTVGGAGTFTLSDSADTVSAISYAGFSGTTTTTVGASNLVFTGGAGNDTLTITGLTSADSLQAGAGTDTLVATVENLPDSLKLVSGFETAKVSLSSGTNSFSLASGGNTLTTVEITAMSASTNTVSLSDLDTGDNVRLAYTSNGANAAYHLGYASGAAAKVELAAAGVSADGGLSVSGAASLTLSAVASGTSVHGVSGIYAGNATSVVLSAGGSATLNNTVLTANNATTLTVQSSGDANLTVGGTLTASGVTTVNVNADTGTALSTVDFAYGNNKINLNTGAHSINVTSSGLGDVKLGDVVTNTNSQDTITITVGANAAFGSGGTDFDYTNAGSGDLSFALTVGASGIAKWDDLTAGASGSVSGYNIVAANSATVVGGDLTAKSISGVTVVAGAETDVTLGTIGASGSGNTAKTIGNISLSQSTSGTIAVGAVDATSAIGNITVSGGADAGITLGAFSAETIGNLTIVGGASSDVTVDAFEGASASIGNIAITLGEAASAGFTSFSGKDSIGTITIDGSASGIATFASIGASARVGAISVGDKERVTITEIHASGIGAITASGDAFTISNISATTVGDITLAGSGGSVTFGGNGQNANVAQIYIQGSGEITLSMKTGSFSGLSTVGHVGTAVMTLTNASGAENITLGAATNKVYVGTGDVNITATAATGKDYIYLAGSAYDGVNVANFDLLTSATDRIYLSTASFRFGLASASTAVSAAAGALNVVTVSGAGTGFTFASAVDGTHSDVFVLATGQYTSLGAALSGLGGYLSAAATGGAGSAIAAGQDLLVLWYDSNANASKLTLVNASAGPIGGTFTSTYAGNSNTLVTFSGVDITQTSGVSFTDKFQAY